MFGVSSVYRDGGRRGAGQSIKLVGMRSARTHLLGILPHCTRRPRIVLNKLDPLISLIFPDVMRLMWRVCWRVCNKHHHGY